LAMRARRSCSKGLTSNLIAVDWAQSFMRIFRRDITGGLKQVERSR
jgi:hypothetical protein